MRDAVICEPLRTPVGGFGGALRKVPAHELGATVVRSLLARTGLDPAAVDDVLLGHCYPTMEAPAIGRVVALDAGLPVTATGLQIDRRCGSGLQAVLYAALQVQSGASEVVLAGGAESMSSAPFYSTAMRWGVRGGPGVMLNDALARGRVTAGGANFPVPGGMIETAENLRREYGISRTEQDEWAVRSHQRAAAARETVRGRDRPGGRASSPTSTSGPTRASRCSQACGRSWAAATRTPPSRRATRRARTTGPPSASSRTPERAAELGLRPLARLVSWGVGGVPPATMGIGPVPATAKALAAAGLTLADMDLVELNEAFAAQVLAVLREWKLTDADLERVNVNGSGISLGHPVGATGGRILATLLREMDRRGARYGLETMCIGGGQGLAAVFERIGLMTEEELATADAVSTALIRLVRLLERTRAQYQAENPDAVERATYLLLVHLVKDGPRRAGALADAVHSDPSTISRQIGHLVKLGYVERTADPEDGRATLLAATAEGRRVLEENRRLRNERFSQILASWSDADRAALSAMLGRLAADIETFVGEPSAPRAPGLPPPPPPHPSRAATTP